MEDDLSISTLHKEVEWLQSVIDQVIRSYLMQEGHEKRWLDIPLPDLEENGCAYARSVKEWDLNVYGRLALALTLAPHIRPEVLDIFFGKNQLYDRGFTEFGGMVDKNHSGFLPTAQTFCFLVTATEPALRTEVLKVIARDSVHMRENVLVLGETEAHLPRLTGVLS